MLASKGYPERYQPGQVIEGLDASLPDGVTVYHAGTRRRDDGALVTAGGRVLCVTALGDTLREAHARAYTGVEAVSFEGAYWRKDIGHRALGAPA